MHELALCQGVMDALEKARSDQGFEHILSVHLEIGKLVAVDLHQLSFSFKLLAKNTVAENAELIVEELAAEGFCSRCQLNVELENLYSPCPHCGKWGLDIVKGRELKVSQLEVV